MCTPAVTYFLICMTQQSNASDGHTKTDFFHSNQSSVRTSLGEAGLF